VSEIVEQLKKYINMKAKIYIQGIQPSTTNESIQCVII